MRGRCAKVNDTAGALGTEKRRGKASESVLRNSCYGDSKRSLKTLKINELFRILGVLVPFQYYRLIVLVTCYTSSIFVCNIVKTAPHESTTQYFPTKLCRCQARVILLNLY